MPITEAMLKEFIITQVGDITGGPVQANINLIWDLHEDKSYIAPLLQYYYALSSAAETMIGALREKFVDFMTDRVTIENSQQVKALQTLRGDALLAIEKIEKKAMLNRSGQVGDITKTEPLNSSSDPSTVGWPEAGHRIYRGDPYFPRGE